MLWRRRGSVSTTKVPGGDQEKMAHKPYRAWFTREAIQLLGVQAEIDRYLGKRA